MNSARILPNGELSYGLLLSHVLQAIADQKCSGVSVLHLQDPRSGLEGSIVFRNAKYICAAKMCDRKIRAKGYEALRILCAVAVANYEYDSQPGQNPNQELVLRLELTKIIELCPTLPETLNVLQNQGTLLDQIFNPSTTVTNAAQLIPDVQEGFLTTDLRAPLETEHEHEEISQPAKEESELKDESDETPIPSLDEVARSPAVLAQPHAEKMPGAVVRLWSQSQEHRLMIVASLATAIGLVAIGILYASNLRYGGKGTDSSGATEEQPAASRSFKNVHSVKAPTAATQRAHTAMANQAHRKPASHKLPDSIH